MSKRDVPEPVGGDNALQLETRHEGAAAVVTAKGEIDMESATSLRETLVKLINAGNDPVVLDMNAVTFMDSTGLSALIVAQKLSREHDSELRLAGVNGGPAKVLKITGLSEAFPSWGTVEEAFASK